MSTQPFYRSLALGPPPPRWDRAGVSPALLGVINELAVIAVDGADAPMLLHHLAEMAPLVSAADGAGTMILHGERLDLVHADSPRTTAVESVQDRVQEGPCRTSIHTLAPVAVSDLADEQATTTWPHLSAAALDAGLHSTLAVPLLIRGRAEGVLDLYRERPHTWSVADLLTAQTLAQISAALMVLTSDRDLYASLSDDPTSWGLLPEEIPTHTNPDNTPTS